MRLDKRGNHFSDSAQFAQAILVAHHEVDGRILALHELREIEWLAEDEEAATECVAHLEFGVLCHLHLKLLVAEITEGAAAVGAPRHFHPVANIKFFGIDVGRKHLVGAVVLVDFFDELVPPIETQELRKDFQCAVARLVGTVNITPEAFQRRGTHGLARALEDGAAEKDEIGGRLHLAFQVGLDAVLEFRDFRAGFLHGFFLTRDFGTRDTRL